jgi:hypothetical protein
MAKKITYECGRVCKAVPKTIHLAAGDQVTLKAKNVDVDITFKKASPFTSGALKIHIPKGSSDLEVVKASAYGTFEYTLRCTNPICPSSVSNPKMIVP